MRRVIAGRDLYCCLLPQCEALRACRSGFSIATSGSSFLDNKIVLRFAFDYKYLLAVISTSHSPCTKHFCLML